MREKTDVEKLLKIMSQLRDPNTGCPWDIKQDFSSIAPYTVEEAYEVQDAIQRNDMIDLKEELGDLLFQVVFHSQMAEEQELFDFQDVVNEISDKMLRRHPHIFGDDKMLTPEDVRENWHKIKAQEKADKQIEKEKLGYKAANKKYVLDDIEIGLPALKKGQKISESVVKYGFEWPNIMAVFDKLNEEILEVKEAIEEKDQTHIEEEIGDLLFVTINIARKCGVDAETALTKANDKFTKRFNKVEDHLSHNHSSIEQASLDEMENAWQIIKQKERHKKSC